MKFNYQPYTQLADSVNKDRVQSRVDENGKLIVGEQKVEMASTPGMSNMGGHILPSKEDVAVMNPFNTPKLFNGFKAPELDQKKADILTKESADRQAAEMKTGGGDFGNSVQENAGDILQFGAQTLGNFQNTAGSSKESSAQIMQGTVQGASIGMKIGGPWGALAGAGIGAGVNLLDAKRDKFKRIDEGDRESRADFLDIKNDRKQSYIETGIS